MKRFLRQMSTFFTHFLLLATLLLVNYPTFALSNLPNPPSPLSFFPYATGEPEEALRQAEINPAAERPELLIKAAIGYIQRNELEKAKGVIDTLLSDPITVQQMTQTKLLQARVALYEKQAQETLDTLYTLPPYLPYPMMIMQQDLQARAYEALGQPITSLEQRLALQPRLKNNAEQQANLQAIWKTIQHIPSKQVVSFHNVTHNSALKGWLNVAIMQSQYQQDPIALERAINQWQASYPNHPGLAIANLHVVARAKPLENDKKSVKSENRLPAPFEVTSESAQVPVTTATTVPTAAGTAAANVAAAPVSVGVPAIEKTAVMAAKSMATTAATAAAAASTTASTFPAQSQSTQSPSLGTATTTPALPRQPTIAVLLPKTGEFAQAARAIEQGIILAYYQDTAKKRPVLQFYDSSKNVRDVYQRAIQRGASAVIGPLAKEEVLELYQGKYFPVTTIVLNELGYSVRESVYNAFYQFSLSGEDEAYQAALRANQDNRMQALIIRSDKPWAKKLDETFTQSFERFGGSIRERLTFDAKLDPTLAIRNLLQYYDAKETPSNKSWSESNSPEAIKAREQLHQLANGTQSRHRTDVDMIFLALSPAQAQQVIPLLKFYYAQDIPVYTTSIINSQGVDERQDLDGALFCDMPWIVNNTFKAEELRQTLNQLWPDSYSTHPRLYAFGIDAYRIARDLQNQNPAIHQGLSGYTGMLSLVSGHKVYRQLPWAQIRNGKFRLLDDTRVR